MWNVTQLYHSYAFIQIRRRKYHFQCLLRDHRCCKLWIKEYWRKYLCVSRPNECRLTTPVFFSKTSLEIGFVGRTHFTGNLEMIVRKLTHTIFWPRAKALPQKGTAAIASEGVRGDANPVWFASVIWSEKRIPSGRRIAGRIALKSGVTYGGSVAQHLAKLDWLLSRSWSNAVIKGMISDRLFFEIVFSATWVVAIDWNGDTSRDLVQKRTTSDFDIWLWLALTPTCVLCGFLRSWDWMCG